jgi:hypothetical protein
MDRWDWIYLHIVTTLTALERLSYEECDAEWDRVAWAE